jgi:hypothetical protein
MALYYANLRRYGARAALVRQIAWAGDSWLPPKLFAGSYQVPGKIAKDLHPAEVALLFELPLARVVALMVEGLQAKGMVNLLGEEPLRISITSAKPGEGLEEAFLACFDSEGRALSGLLTDFFEGLIKDLQEKLWDCDMEATKTYYRSCFRRLSGWRPRPTSGMRKPKPGGRAGEPPIPTGCTGTPIATSTPTRFGMGEWASMRLFPPTMGSSCAPHPAFLAVSARPAGPRAPASRPVTTLVTMPAISACHSACHFGLPFAVIRPAFRGRALKLPWAFKPSPKEGLRPVLGAGFLEILRPYLIARQEDECSLFA